MKVFNKYISFSKLLVFTLVLAFFIILAFDGWVIITMIDFIRQGINLAYATVVGTIVSVMSTFSNAVILFAIKTYLTKSGLENSVGYDAKTNTIADERIKAMMSKTMNDVNYEEECDF